MSMPTVVPEKQISVEREEEINQIRLRLTKEKVNEVIDGLIDVVGSEQFVGYVNEISAVPSHSERNKMTAETANLENLKQLGIDVPAEMRLTTRQFENPADGKDADSPLVKVNPALDPRMGFCGSLGFYLCASYGG